MGENVLTIGPNYRPPRGGIAQVMSYYDEFIFKQFNFVANSCDGGILAKVWCLLNALFQCIFIFVTNPKVRIVHIHTASYNSFTRSVIFMRLAKLFSRRVVMHVHGGEFRLDYNKRPKFISRALRKCNSVVVITNGNKSFFEKEIGLDNVTVVANVVPNPHFDRDFSTITTTVHALFMGAVCDNKGIFDLLEVIGKNKDSFNRHLIIHIAGSGDIERCKNLIAEFGIEDIVKYEGWLTGGEKRLMLEKCSLFILPSYVEVLPMSVLEAMSFSMAVISTTVGGIPEVVNDGISGLLVRPGDKESLCACIMRLVSKPHLIHQMGLEGQKIAKNYFPQTIEAKLENIYKRICV